MGRVGGCWVEGFVGYLGFRGRDGSREERKVYWQPGSHSGL